jgi:hypothetical protein
VLADLSVTVCFTKTFPSPITRGLNLAVALASANKHP